MSIPPLQYIKVPVTIFKDCVNIPKRKDKLIWYIKYCKILKKILLSLDIIEEAFKNTLISNIIANIKAIIVNNPKKALSILSASLLIIIFRTLENNPNIPDEINKTIKKKQKIKFLKELNKI